MAEKDVFGQQVNQTSTSIITSHRMILTIEGAGITTKGALVQNVAIQYAQPIQIIREVGSANFYYFAQPPQGTVSFGRIVAADRGILEVLPKGEKNIWSVPGPGQSSPTLILEPTDIGSKITRKVIYTMRQCIVENLGINTDANGAFVQENVSIRFGSMLIGAKSVS